MANCAKCTKFYSPFVWPVCDQKDCPVPEGQKSMDHYGMTRPNQPKGRMMFDTSANRHAYEDALTRHDELMAAETDEAKSYQNGYAGHDEKFLDVHEFWRAGVKNRFRHRKDE